MRRLLVFAFAALVTGAACYFGANAVLLAQNRMRYPIASDDSGHVALGLALRKLGVSGTFMECPAHPDDETNALFTTYGLGAGLRVVDVQNNRGEGGQNEIGPELFRDIGVLRTSELLSAHRIDGAEQFFTRAIDYGYSWDPNEVIQKWGREEIVGDYVRLIRTLRPDVVATMNIQGSGGDRAHEATTLLAREAYAAAGDPTKYPEQIREGLRAWQPRKLYFRGGSGVIGGRGGRAGAAPAGPAARSARVDTSAFDALLGRTYAEIAADARSNHKCQGVGGGIPNLAAGAGGRGGAGGGAVYTLMSTTLAGQQDKDETSLFDAIDVSLPALARYAGTNPPAALITGLNEIARQAAAAKAAFDAGKDAETAAPIEAGLAALRALRGGVATMPGLDDGARYEIDFRLKLEEKDFEDALVVAHGLVMQAVANDGLVIAGQPVTISVAVANRGAANVEYGGLTLAGFEGQPPCERPAGANEPSNTIVKGGTFSCSAPGIVPASAKLTEPYFTDKYWKTPANPARNDFDPSVPFGVPFAPTPFRAGVVLKFGSLTVTRDVPVEFRYVKDLYFGDKRMELNVVPAFSVKVTPAMAVFPTGASRTTTRSGLRTAGSGLRTAGSGLRTDGSGVRATGATRDVFVTVTNGTKGAAKTTVALEVPAGWRVTPATASIAFQNEDESLSAKFQVTAPAAAKAGTYSLRAMVTSDVTGAQAFSNGYHEIDYPHVQRRQVIKPAETTVKVLDVRTAPNLKVGYVMGVGDQIPPALEQLGAKVTLIDSNELAWGDLSAYDVIMTGVRAYERRADLRAYNRRLLDYVERGGTMLVNYNKTEFNGAGPRGAGGGRGGAGGAPGAQTAVGYGPYPATVDGSRVNDESVGVNILSPAHPVFNFPNEIGPLTWANWTQERGQYFMAATKDPKYVDLVSMTDSFPDNPGVKLGSLVEAKYGKGRWVYIGLGLWRQLPAGTEGAYQLLANLISLPRAPAVPARGR